MNPNEIETFRKFLMIILQSNMKDIDKTYSILTVVNEKLKDHDKNKEGFTIKCNNCGSEDISAYGGDGASVAIFCNSCDNEQ